MTTNVYEKMYDDLLEEYLELKEMKRQYEYMKDLTERLYKSGLEGYVQAIKGNNETREHYNYNQATTCGLILGKDILKIDEELKKIKEDGTKKAVSIEDDKNMVG